MILPHIRVTWKCIMFLLLDLEISKENFTGYAEFMGRRLEIKNMRKCIVSPNLDAPSLSSHRSLFITKETI